MSALKYDLQTCIEKIRQYIKLYPKLKDYHLDQSKTCELLYDIDKKFPIAGTWCEFYNVPDLMDILYYNDGKKKKKSSIVIDEVENNSGWGKDWMTCIRLSVARKYESHNNFRNLMDELLIVMKVRNDKIYKNKQNQIFNQKHKQEIKKKKAIFYQKNKVKIALTNKIYRTENSVNINIKHNIKKDDRKLKSKEKVTCDCGKILTKYSIYEHRKGKYHLNYELDKKNTPQIEEEVEEEVATCIFIRGDQKVNCVCGKILRKDGLNRHYKTKYHNDNAVKNIQPDGLAVISR